jgi:alpha-ribazole phosphatase/probable phosphoglycerate mutase
MELMLIRHGETVWNKEGRVQGISDIELNAEGIEQARLLALSLKDYPFDTIHSSPLKRALQTAEIINEYHQKKIHTHDDLMEMNTGDLDGLSYEELAARDKDLLKKMITDPASVEMPNGESINQLLERAWRAMETIIDKRENALVASHNFIIAAIICRIKNINLNEFLSACVGNASKTVVKFQNGGLFIETFNDQSHLSGK